MYQGLQSLAPFLIANAARNVQSGCLWRDNNIAAFEQELGGHRNGFPWLCIAGHLYIQRLANENQVPVARIPPLARLLHKHLKVGEPIPAPLFEVVAKVLAWAYEIKQATSTDELPLPEIGALPDLELGAKASAN